MKIRSISILRVFQNLASHMKSLLRANHVYIGSAGIDGEFSF